MIPECELRIHKANGSIQIPPLVEEVTWETKRKNTPGKLTFKVPKLYDGLSFVEGDRIEFRYENRETSERELVFTGYIFTKKRDKEGLIEVTAYDDLRYFKNNFTYVFEDKKASEILHQMLKDNATFDYDSTGIEETDYVIASLVEDDQTMFDIVQDALDLTVMNTGSLYVLYCDEANRVSLKNIESLKTNLVINASTAENIDYTSSIDNEVYNMIHLYYDNDQTNKRETYVEKDTESISRWGLLKYTESIRTNVNANEKAKALLKLYNQKRRNLKVNGAFGNVQCRAGASVIVDLSLGDIIVNNRMLIESATHKFTDNHHSMDLVLSGNRGFAE